MKGTLVLSLVQQHTSGSLQSSHTHFFVSGFQSFILGCQFSYITISLLAFHLCVPAFSKSLHFSLSEGEEDGGVEVCGATHCPFSSFVHSGHIHCVSSFGLVIFPH
jgi:hypothetical protein